MDLKGNSYCGDEFLVRIVQMMACNEVYLKCLEKLIDKVDEHIDRNREQQAYVQSQIRKLKSVRPLRATKSPTAFVHCVPYLPPYFKDMNGMTPSWNTEVWKMSQVCTVNPLMGVERKWFAQELQLLKNSVVKSFKRSEVIPLVSRRDRIVEKLTVSCTAAPKDTKMLWLSQIKQIDRRIVYLKERSDEQVLKINKSLDVDWDTISASDFNGTRSPMQLRMKWLNEVSPVISTAAWSDLEDSALMRLLHTNSINWDEVATRLATARTAFQCFNRLLYLHENQKKKEYWTVEEDDELRALVFTSTVRGKINWQKVITAFPNKTMEQCKSRYKRSLEEKLGRGRWSTEEDLQLCIAVDKYGPQRWEQVAKHVRIRSAVQCRARWIDTLDPQRRNKPWIWEEHLRLFFGLELLGRKNFSKVALMLPGRNSTDVQSRVRALKYFKFLVFEAQQDGRQEPVYQIMPNNYFTNKLRRESVFRRFLEFKVKTNIRNEAPDIGLGSLVFSPSGVLTDFPERKRRQSNEDGKIMYHPGSLWKLRKTTNEFGSEELNALIRELPAQKSVKMKKFLAASDVRYAAELEEEEACGGNIDELTEFYEAIMTVGRAKVLQEYLNKVICIDETDIARRLKYFRSWINRDELHEEDEEGDTEESSPRRKCVLREYDYSRLISK